MQGKRRIVVAGDNLWNIAKEELGAGAQWPRIWRYNNRRDVIKVTGRAIPDPDLIYVGQLLLIPVSPRSPPPVAAPSPPPAGLAPAAPPHPPAPSPQPLRQGPLGSRLPQIQSPVSFKYRLDDIRLPPFDTPTALIEMRMTGDVLLMSRKAYPALYVTSRRELEAQITQEMHHAFGRLVSDNRVIFDPAEKRVTVRSMLVSQSNTPNAPSTAIGVEISSNSPVPKLRAEIRWPKLEGTIEGFLYSALDVKFVIEITPKVQPPRAPSPQPIRIEEPSVNWDRVIGTGLIVTAGVIVVATIVEDFLTAGAGVADDAPSFTAAGAALTRGLSMLRGVSALPRAAAGTVFVGAGVQHAH